MSAEGNMTLEYLHAAKERFQQTGKLFLVDYSKSCAAEVLLSILKDDNPPSFLMIAENPVSPAGLQYGKICRTDKAVKTGDFVFKTFLVPGVVSGSNDICRFQQFPQT